MSLTTDPLQTRICAIALNDGYMMDAERNRLHSEFMAASSREDLRAWAQGWYDGAHYIYLTVYAEQEMKLGGHGVAPDPSAAQATPEGGG